MAKVSFYRQILWHQYVMDDIWTLTLVKHESCRYMSWVVAIKISANLVKNCSSYGRNGAASQHWTTPKSPTLWLLQRWLRLVAFWSELVVCYFWRNCRSFSSLQFRLKNHSISNFTTQVMGQTLKPIGLNPCWNPSLL